MPVDDTTGMLIPFTSDQIAAMKIRTFEVRGGEHPTETRKPDENTMTRTFLVDYVKRYDFVELLMGDSVTFQVEDPPSSGTFVTKISRLLPNSTFGRHPTLSQLIASRIEYIRGHGSAGIDDVNSMPSYKDAEVQVYYEHQPYILRSDAGLTTERSRFVYLGDSTESEADAYTVPGSAFKYIKPDGTGPGAGGALVPIPFNYSIIRPVERFTLWWDWLPFDVVSSQGALYKRLYFGGDDGGGDPDGIPFIGTVNSEALEIASAGQLYEPGQLLLEGVTRIKRRSPLVGSGADGWRWKIGLKFAMTPRGWCDLFFWDPATPANSGYYRVVNGSTYHDYSTMPDKASIFNCRDHNLLFDPNYS